MIEDRLRELRVEEPDLVLDLDVLVDTAEVPRRRRRSVVATTVAVLLTATAAMIVGGLRDARPPAAGTLPVAEPTVPPTTFAARCVDRNVGLWPKVLRTHLPKARLEPLRPADACPVYRVLDSGELLGLGVWRPAAPAAGSLVSDEKAADGGRVEIYDRLVRWVGPDGTVVQATTTGTISPDRLIAIVTDPILRR